KRKCATSGPRGRADRRIKCTGGCFDPGLQPGQYCYRGKRLACHAAAYTGSKRERNYVELANDWRGDRVSRAVGDCNCFTDLGCEARNSREAIGRRGDSSTRLAIQAAKPQSFFAIVFGEVDPPMA